MYKSATQRKFNSSNKSLVQKTYITNNLYNNFFNESKHLFVYIKGCLYAHNLAAKLNFDNIIKWKLPDEKIIY